jgi:hypothetical protein
MDAQISNANMGEVLYAGNVNPLTMNGDSGLVNGDANAIHGCNGANGSNGVSNAQRGSMSHHFVSCKTEWVRLNIGGQYFVTTKTTLCKNPQSFFFKLLQDDPSIGLTTDRV